MEIQTQSVALSKNPETEGFDRQAGESWIYPTNYSTRDYQYNIIQAALLKNTLVSLPTGLGKTFIAAVVMYNFYRWYPHGKIIFMAPTRPLVKQQIEACYNIMAIPPDVTAELTGTKVSSSRSNIWLDKRVFFVTPQVLQNDLEKVAQLGPKIKCLVFDEAHKARGNHAYCQVIRTLIGNNHKYFRVLALSATPGCSVNDVLEVVNNLLISHLEFRTEESVDVQQYVFQRSLETVVVQLDKKLIETRDEYIKILEQYAKTLVKFNIIQGNCGSLTKGKIFMVMKDFQNKNRGTGSSHYSEIMRCLNICVTLYHAFELLIRHGLRNFLSFFDEHIEKPLLRGNIKLRSIIENVRSHLGPIPHIEVLPDGTYPEIPKDIKFGHPKHYKLRDILISHFSGDDKKNTRVIVFFEYRESVMEAHTLLLQSRPLIKAKIFLGQGSGVTQKTQLGVIKAFKEGKCNTLLSTCIGEEGLDVGEVDLIVCFDISNKSPIRMVQRMGRTGRKRAGSVLILVTEGKEQQTLKDCLIHKNNIITHVLGSAQINNGVYQDNPRLVPADLIPKCEKMFITVRDITKKNNIMEKLQHSSGSADIIFSQNNDVLDYHDLIPETKMMSFTTGCAITISQNFGLFNKHIEKMRTAHRVCLVEHSEHATILNELLCYADSKRFNIPTKTQVEINGFTGKSLKQGDIRSMFLKEKNNCGSSENDAIEVVRNTSNEELKAEIEEKTDLSRSLAIPIEELFKILSNYLVSDFANELIKCTYCGQNFNCEMFTLNSYQLGSIMNNNMINQNLIPCEDVVNEIVLEDIEDFITSLDVSYYTRQSQQINMLTSPSELENNYCESNAISSSCQKLFLFEAPTTYLKLLETFRDADCKPDCSRVVKAMPKENTEKTMLDFFRLESISDIFYNSSINNSQNTIIYTPEEELGRSNVSKKFDQEHIFDKSLTNSIDTQKTQILNLNDICDLSYFGLANNSITPHINPEKKVDSHSSKLLQETANDTNTKLNLTQNKEISTSSVPVKRYIVSPTPHGTNKNKLGISEESKLNVLNEPKITITQMIDLFDEQPDEIKNSLTPGLSIIDGLESYRDSNDFKNDISPRIQGNVKPVEQKTSANNNSSIACSTDNLKSRRIQDTLKQKVSLSAKRCKNKNLNRLNLKSRTKYHAFLDMEAQVSENEDVFISDDEDDIFTDAYEKSFVNDVTQNFDTQMHGMYLRSIRSPAHRKNVQRNRPIVDMAAVYSQVPSTENNEYIEDSFCVEASDEDLTQQTQLSELDILEWKLKQQKKRKKTAHTHSELPKRRRIQCVSSDDSE